MTGAFMVFFTLFNSMSSIVSGGPEPLPAGYNIPVVDLSDDGKRRVEVDREAGQYLGHVTTVMLADGKTVLAVYPTGHGKGAIVYKRSKDGGRSWSER